MMGGFAPGDGPPHPGVMPPGPPQGGGNFYNNFFGQQDGMKMEGGQEGKKDLKQSLGLHFWLWLLC